MDTLYPAIYIIGRNGLGIKISQAEANGAVAGIGNKYKISAAIYAIPFESFRRIQFSEIAGIGQCFKIRQHTDIIHAAKINKNVYYIRYKYNDYGK